MRFTIVAALGLALAGCGSAAPEQARAGPRLEASLAATWPAEAPARQATFSRDGALLATSDASGAIAIRNTRDWKVVERLRHEGGATSIDFSPDARHLYSAGYDGTVRDWDLARHSAAETLRGAQGTVWTLNVSPDGTKLASAGEDPVIRLWTLGSSAPPTQLRGHERNIWEVRFSPDGRRLASASFDSTVRLWDVRTARAVKTLTG
ncbi:MAG TPA: hypothetical protein VF027_04530, partial [Sphingomicrobium sp.]